MYLVPKLICWIQFSISVLAWHYVISAHRYMIRFVRFKYIIIAVCKIIWWFLRWNSISFPRMLPLKFDFQAYTSLGISWKHKYLGFSINYRTPASPCLSSTPVGSRSSIFHPQRYNSPRIRSFPSISYINQPWYKCETQSFAPTTHSHPKTEPVRHLGSSGTWHPVHVHLSSLYGDVGSCRSTLAEFWCTCLHISVHNSSEKRTESWQ